jgi:hypothetical protein
MPLHQILRDYNRTRLPIVKHLVVPLIVNSKCSRPLISAHKSQAQFWFILIFRVPSWHQRTVFGDNDISIRSTRTHSHTRIDSAPMSLQENIHIYLKYYNTIILYSNTWKPCWTSIHTCPIRLSGCRLQYSSWYATQANRLAAKLLEVCISSGRVHPPRG